MTPQPQPATTTGQEGAVLSGPPKRPFTLKIEADGDNTAALSSILNSIDYRLWEQPDQERHIVSGGGWTLTLTRNRDGLAGDEYDAALAEWWKAERAARGRS